MKTIRELRENAGLTQLELAIKVGVTPTTVYNWERGMYAPSVKTLRLLAALFKVPMEQIETKD